MTNYFFAIRVVEKYANKAALDLAELLHHHEIITGEPSPVYSILVPVDVRGFIVVEAKKKHEVLPFIRRVKQTRGMIAGKLTLDEVVTLATPRKDILEVGLVIDVVEGPFRGCEARVIEDDGVRVTVEILEWERENRISLQRSQVRRRR